MNEVHLTLEDIAHRYRQLDMGDHIRIGDLFQRKAGAEIRAGLGERVQPTRKVFERIDENTRINGQRLADRFYVTSLPMVLRPLK